MGEWMAGRLREPSYIGPVGGGIGSAAGRIALRAGVAAAATAVALCAPAASSGAGPSGAGPSSAESSGAGPSSAASSGAESSGAASSLAAPRAPLTVRSASLSQRGRRLRLTVTLREPLLSSRSLSRQHRSLCLLLERRRSGALFAQLCLAPPAGRDRGARVLLTRIARGRAGASRPIAAMIARPSIHRLSVTFTPASVGIGYRSLRWQVASGLEPPLCVPARVGAAAGPPVSVGGGGTCRLLYPLRPRLARLHTPRLVGCLPARRGSSIFEGPSNRREIALTFDDGPWNDPPSIDFVNLLARYHVPATFFEIGSQISGYDPAGAVERRMLAAGDMIGDHTWTHPDMLTLSAGAQRSQLQLTQHAIKRATGFTPCLWRPPYGAVNSSLSVLAGSLGMSTILWNVDPRDWSLPGVGSIEGNVLANARNGAIVDMHFGGGPRQQTLAALPRIITTLRSRGYRLVTLTTLLGMRLIYR